MKFSYNWLRDLVDQLDTPPRELAQLITIKTAESEGVEPHGNDFVIEIDNKSLTHRPDLWGHYGMAREVAAILDRKLIDPVKPAQFSGSAPVRVSIEDHAL
jgi:phenylalanyl-tRNA synthetase beta chain